MVHVVNIELHEEVLKKATTLGSHDHMVPHHHVKGLSNALGEQCRKLSIDLFDCLTVFEKHAASLCHDFPAMQCLFLFFLIFYTSPYQFIDLVELFLSYCCFCFSIHHIYIF